MKGLWKIKMVEGAFTFICLSMTLVHYRMETKLQFLCGADRRQRSSGARWPVATGQVSRANTGHSNPGKKEEGSMVGQVARVF